MNTGKSAQVNEKKGKNGFLSKDAAAVIVGGWLFSVSIICIIIITFIMDTMS